MKIQRAFLLGLIVLKLLGCGRAGVEIATLTIKTEDTERSAVGNVVLNEFSIREGVSGRVSSADSPAGVTATMQTDSEFGEAKLSVAKTTIAFFASKASRMTALVTLNLMGNLDLRHSPILSVLSASRTQNHCTETLNVPKGQGWLRVFKVQGNFSDVDVLRVFSTNGRELGAGSDLANERTANGSLNYIDLYQDALFPVHGLGHANVSVETKEPQTLYRIQLNSTTIVAELKACDQGYLSVVYLPG